ncbi:MAG: type II toxin-antitoxin system VapC family toxin [Trichodesmium sp.]
MRAIIADNGPLYAAIDPDDQYHQQAQTDLNQLQQENLRVIVTYSTLLEAYTLVLYRLGNETARAFLQQIFAGVELINPTVDDYLAATELVENFPDQRITLFDGITAIISNRLSLPVWSYDYHFDVMLVSVWRY